MWTRALVAVAILCSCGCDVLFPEFFPTTSDAAATDAASDGSVSDGGDSAVPATPHLAGQVCALADLRDWRTCAAAAGSFTITVEETAEAVTTDASGAFTLPTARPLTAATLHITDGSGRFAATVTVAHPPGGAIDHLALPVVPADTLTIAAEEAGFALDPARGALLAWAVDSTGTPVAGVRSQPPATADGPFSDGAEPNLLIPAAVTQARGLIALFDLAAGTLRLPLTPPQPYVADSYDLPIRAGALTLTTLALH